MQQKEESNNTTGQNVAAEKPNQMATNPNPRANENIKGSPIDKDTTPGDASDVGSEITDGEAS